MGASLCDGVVEGGGGGGSCCVGVGTKRAVAAGMARACGVGRGGALRLSPEWQSNMMKLEPEAADVASAHLDGS